VGAVFEDMDHVMADAAREDQIIGQFVAEAFVGHVMDVNGAAAAGLPIAAVAAGCFLGGENALAHLEPCGRPDVSLIGFPSGGLRWGGCRHIWDHLVFSRWCSVERCTSAS
jgi:hypothetical protein